MHQGAALRFPVDVLHILARDQAGAAIIHRRPVIGHGPRFRRGQHAALDHRLEGGIVDVTHQAPGRISFSARLTPSVQAASTSSCRLVISPTAIMRAVWAV